MKLTLLLGERGAVLGVPIERLGLALYQVDDWTDLTFSADELLEHLDERSSLPAVELPRPAAHVAAVGRVAAALLAGRALASGDYTVGAWSDDPETGALRWAAAGEHGEPVWATEEWDQAGKDGRYREVGGRDWSAFAAARAFVTVVGVAGAEQALEQVRGLEVAVGDAPSLTCHPARSQHGDAIHAVVTAAIVRGRWRREPGQAVCKPRGLRLRAVEGAIDCRGCLGELTTRGLRLETETA